MVVKKVGRRDYVVDPYTCAKVRHDPPRGFVSAHAVILKIVKSPHFSKKSSDFDEIRYTAAAIKLDESHVTKH